MSDVNTEQLRNSEGAAAVKAARQLLGELNARYASVKFPLLPDGTICLGLSLPEWTYQLCDAGRWHIILQNEKDGRLWLQSTVWMIQDADSRRINALPQAEGAGRVSDYPV